jgi:hypothetical protein
VTQFFQVDEFMPTENPLQTPWPERVWSACADCALLINANKLEELVQRAVTAQFHLHPELVSLITPDQFAEQLRPLYAEFFRRRRLPADP